MSDAELVNKVLQVTLLESKKNKKTPFYFVNVNHPAIRQIYNDWRLKNMQYPNVPPSDKERLTFEVSLLDENTKNCIKNMFLMREQVRTTINGYKVGNA